MTGWADRERQRDRERKREREREMQAAAVSVGVTQVPGLHRHHLYLQGEKAQELQRRS